MAKAKKKTKKADKIPKVSHNKQSGGLTLRQWQVRLRQQFGQEQAFTLSNEGSHPVWSDFVVSNAARNSAYRVALRGKEPGSNFCECLDFKVSGLGTCKHIEWALHQLENTRGNKQYFRKPQVERAYSSVYLHYGDQRRTLRIRIGTEQREAFEVLAGQYFDEEGVFWEHAYLDFDNFLRQARTLSPDFRCYPDVMDWVLQKRADARRAEHAQRLADTPGALKNLVKAELYPYQKDGVLFAFRAGRSLLADEMGLGKTIQAIATAELYRREYGISSVYIICPTSLKYQWQAEIQQFTDSSVLVVEGAQHLRIAQYDKDDSFFKILTYNVVARDFAHINNARPDLLILDEAQRIKNWNTKISRAVKSLDAPYRMALTGTPLENKLEDLYSIVQFVDQYLLGPLYLLLYRHIAKDDHGIVVGYRHLDEINEKLKGVMLRRKKKEVVKQLPRRRDKNLFVPMTPQQRAMHNSFDADVAILIAKWRRLNYLSEQDRLRLMGLLQMMRMSCNSTYIVDQKTRHDTKIDELLYILEEHLTDPQESVVIFSQWQRMTHLVASELEAREVPFVHLHGGVPSKKRGELLDRFREDAACRVFLSTDAGGVGLNLQKASLVINLDLPWNPAVLEQRIARVYRLGQKRGVQVINLVSTETIEHKMLFTLKFKSDLANAVLDATEDSVFMSENRFKEFMKNIEKITDTSNVAAEQPVAAESDDDWERPAAAHADDPTPEIDTPDDLQEDAPNTSAPKESTPRPVRQPQGQSNGQPVRTADDAQQLVNDGISFLSKLSQTLSDPKATQTLVSSLVQKDEKSGQTYLKIPVESEAIVQNALKLLGSLFGQR
jgi:superfamily II DNA or RNA helicase